MKKIFSIILIISLVLISCKTAKTTTSNTTSVKESINNKPSKVERLVDRNKDGAKRKVENTDIRKVEAKEAPQKMKLEKRQNVN